MWVIYYVNLDEDMGDEKDLIHLNVERIIETSIFFSEIHTPLLAAKKADGYDDVFCDIVLHLTALLCAYFYVRFCVKKSIPINS